MNPLAALYARFGSAGEADAVAWRETVTSYAGLLARIAACGRRLRESGVPRGAVVTLEGDFSPSAIAMLFALIEHEAIVVPLTRSVQTKQDEYCRLAQVEVRIAIDDDGTESITPTGRTADHRLVARLREVGHPGLILFSSGSTGESKGTVHDFLNLVPQGPQRRPRRTLMFLLFDHIGGINSLLDVLANAGCAVGLPERSPDAICAAIERHRVDVLPTTPTFLRLLLLSGAAERFDLGSLELITFGTEPMPESTLVGLRERFPGVRLLQQYGLSEGGILRTQRKADDPLWLRLEGDGLETRIVDGMLEIRSRTAMLGYLSAPDPFTPDGWLRTGDAVVVEGDFIRIVGRKSDMINVGGEKVFPAEVEDVLELMDDVVWASVRGEPNAITGQMIVASVQLASDEPLASFRARMRAFCAPRLPRYKIPQKVELATGAFHGARFKKRRLADPAEAAPPSRRA